MSEAGDFRLMLKNYRKANGMTQKALASRLGVSTETIINYENCRSRPSPDIRAKLAAEMNCEVSLILCGTHDPRDSGALTEEERQFAEKHHEFVMMYLRIRGLSYDEWYDVVIFGYLRAVKTWFKRADLHKYSFKTIAFHSMRSSVSNVLQKPCLKTVFIYDAIPGFENFTYADILCDPRDCVGI